MHDIFRSRVIFLVPIFFWKAEGDVSLGFGAGVAGLGFVLPRGPGSGDRRPSIKGDKKNSENYKNLKNYKNLIKPIKTYKDL